MGFPLPSHTWISPTESSFSAANASADEQGIVASTVRATNRNGADSGGTFTCTASNGIGNYASAHAMVSGKSVNN